MVKDDRELFSRTEPKNVAAFYGYKLEKECEVKK